MEESQGGGRTSHAGGGEKDARMAQALRELCGHIERVTKPDRDQRHLPDKKGLDSLG